MDRIIQELAIKVFNRLNTNNNLTNDRELYIHAIVLIAHEFLNYLIVLVVAVMVNLVIESIIYMVLFSIIRRYTGGFHAKTYLKCMLSYIAFYLLFLEFYLVVNVRYIEIILILFVISVIYIYKTSPVQHVNNPLSIIEKHKYRKISMIVLFVFILLVSSNCGIKR